MVLVFSQGEIVRVLAEASPIKINYKNNHNCLAVTCNLSNLNCWLLITGPKHHAIINKATAREQEGKTTKAREGVEKRDKAREIKIERNRRPQKKKKQ